MDKLDMFQSRSGKIDEFGWWDLEIISGDAGTKFTLTEFKEECQNHGVCLTLDLFQPKTDLFSTRSLIGVHFKTVRYLS